MASRRTGAPSDGGTLSPAPAKRRGADGEAERFERPALSVNG